MKFSIKLAGWVLDDLVFHKKEEENKLGLSCAKLSISWSLVYLGLAAKTEYQLMVGSN